MTPATLPWCRRSGRWRGKGSILLLTAIIVLSLLLIEVTSQSNQDRPIRNHRSGNRTKRDLPSEFARHPSKPEENSWYAVVLAATRKITTESCYVCTQLPHGAGASIPVTPRPLNVSETLGVMVAFSLGVSLQNRTVKDMTETIKLQNISIVNFKGSTARFWNMTQVRRQRIHQFIMTTNPTRQSGTVCFTRKCFTDKDYYLGTSLCKQTVIATCGLVWDKGKTSSCRYRVPYLAPLNLTDTVSLNRPGSDNPVVLMPSSDGYGSLRQHVWVCGQRVYQSLRSGWCGTCYLAKLVPSVIVLPTHTHFHTYYAQHYTPHREKRSTERISQWKKGVWGFSPWWETVNNAFKIDEVALELETLTALVTSGFSALSPTIQGVHNVALQNRIAMDMMFASQRGFCHIIGPDCCTYIPDSADNMTHVVSHLNDLLHEKRRRDSKSEGWRLWSWLIKRGLNVTLIKILTPLLTVFVLIAVLICCSIPRNLCMSVHASI